MGLGPRGLRGRLECISHTVQFIRIFNCRGCINHLSYRRWCEGLVPVLEQWVSSLNEYQRSVFKLRRLKGLETERRFLKSNFAALEPVRIVDERSLTTI